MRRSVLAAVAAALLVGGLAGCTSSASGGSTAASSAVDLQADSGRMPAAAGGASADQTAAVERSVVTTGSLQLAAEDPVAVAGRIEALAEQAGGRVSRSNRDPSGRASAELVLRIPAQTFPRTLTAIERQGDVRDVSIGATDVTAKVTDYTVRIANLRTSIARLQQLLAKADSSSALVTIEGALTERQTSLERLLAQQRELTDQVSLATLTVSVVTPEAAPAKGPGDFFAGVAAGAQGLAQVVGASVVGFGIVLPWLALLGAIGGVALAVRRALRRRARPTSA